MLWEEKNLIEPRKNGMNSTENIECVPTGNMQIKNVRNQENAITKKCVKCNIVKFASNFNRHKINKDHLCSYCKECSKILFKAYFLKNKERVNERHRNDYKKYGDKWKSTRKAWNVKNREKFKSYTAKWRNTHREEYNDKIMKRYHSDICFKLRKTIPSAIRKSLRSNKNNIKWEYLVKYTMEELKIHLESKFRPGMSWNNYGKWHIDHIIPVSSFNIDGTASNGFRECWSLSNLRPLWAIDNLIKGAKIL